VCYKLFSFHLAPFICQAIVLLIIRLIFIQSVYFRCW
jgi:hypothetical protein